MWTGFHERNTGCQVREKVQSYSHADIAENASQGRWIKANILKIYMNTSKTWRKISRQTSVYMKRVYRCVKHVIV